MKVLRRNNNWGTILSCMIIEALPDTNSESTFRRRCTTLVEAVKLITCCKFSKLFQ